MSRLVLAASSFGFAAAAAMFLATKALCACAPEPAALGAMKYDLRRVFAAQEVHTRQSGEPTTSLGELGVTPSPGVMISMETTGDGSWQAVARHDEIDSVCRIGVGGWAGRAVPAGDLECILLMLPYPPRRAHRQSAA